MMVETGHITLQTQGNNDIINLTCDLEHILSESGLTDGLMNVFCPSSTSSVTTMEYEGGSVSDLKRMLEEMVPSDRAYAHNATWEDGNGHSHMRASLLGPSIIIPFAGKKLTLGTWQQVVYLDFDIRPRHRDLVIQMLGE